jgi:hypothetical protein
MKENGASGWEVTQSVGTWRTPSTGSNASFEHERSLIDHGDEPPADLPVELDHAAMVTDACGDGSGPQSMGELLTTIQARGLITRTPGQVGRPASVTLTDAGRSALHRAVPRGEAINRPEALGLTATENATLNTLLHRVRHALGDGS